MEWQKLRLAMIQLITILAIGTGLLIGFASYSENKAERLANDFCEEVKIGEDAASVMNRAISEGANIHQTKWLKVANESDWLPATFTGFTPISRHICSIKSVDGKVTDKKYVYLD